MQEQIGLEAMIHNLLEFDDETWGLYAFSRELLKKKVLPDKKREMITKAIACGREYAQRTIQKYGTADAHAIAEKMKLKVENKNPVITGKRVLFARYTSPDEIEIMEGPVTQAIQLISQKAPIFIELFQQDGIMNTVLGHEIFHFVEDQFEQEIYTRTEKILLWNLMGIKNHSTIRTLSEIGGMAFTKELNNLRYSPFVLDILLYYGYDPSGAEKIYRDVLESSSERCRNS
jgi:hypothetical protein